MSQCVFTKFDGNRCEAHATSDGDLCFSHNPVYADAKLEAVTKGGMVPKKILLNNNEEIILESAADAKRFLSKVISDVWQGNIPATPVASTLGFLVRCFLDAHEKSEIESRLDTIEQEMKKIKS